MGTSGFTRGWARVSLPVITDGQWKIDLPYGQILCSLRSNSCGTRPTVLTARLHDAVNLKYVQRNSLPLLPLVIIRKAHTKQQCRRLRSVAMTLEGEWYTLSRSGSLVSAVGTGLECAQKQEVFLFSNTSRPALGPPRLLWNGYRWSFHGSIAAGAWSWPLTCTCNEDKGGCSLKL